MSILIKGMEMPTDDFIRIILYPNGQAVKANAVDYEEFEAMPVPPHGRLIDADALMENEENISFKDEWHMTVTEAFVSVKNIVDAPTIIESTIGQLNSDPAVNEAEEDE